MVRPPCPWIDWHGGSLSSSHIDVKDLVYMRVHEFEGAMFEDEIECDAHYMGEIGTLWVVGACIFFPWSESQLLCLLCVECLCIRTWHQLWPRGHWVVGVGVFQWGWENVLCFWCVMGGCYLGPRWNGWCRQWEGQLGHHNQKHRTEKASWLVSFGQLIDEWSAGNFRRQ